MSRRPASRTSDPGAAAWWRRVWIVLEKELRDHARDRRSLFLALVYPLLGPVLLGVLLDMSSGGGRVAADGAVEVAAIGIGHAPALAAALEARGIRLRPAPPDPQAAVRAGYEPLILVIPPHAAGRERFTVTMIVDANRLAAGSTILRVAEAIAGYGREISHREIDVLGLDRDILQPITLERLNVGRPANVGALFYNMISPLLIFMVFIGAVYLAIDTTAGERERGSLEPLLTAPVRRWELLLGKTGAAFLFTAATVALHLAAFSLILGGIAAGREEIDPPPGIAAFLAMFAIALPLMALAVTLQMAIAAMTRSMKEAQIYLGLLPVIPALPGMAMAFGSGAATGWAAALPVYGQMLLFGRLAAGEPLDPLAVLASLATTLALSLAIFRWAVHLFQRERQFFSG